MSLAAQIRSQFEILAVVRGVSAVVERGATSCDITVVLGRSNNSGFSRENLIFEADCQDIILLADTYKPGGIVSDPQIDDTFTIFDEESGRTSVYEARLSGDTQQVFTTDNTGTQVRVKTKLLSRT